MGKANESGSSLYMPFCGMDGMDWAKRVDHVGVHFENGGCLISKEGIAFDPYSYAGPFVCAEFATDIGDVPFESSWDDTWLTDALKSA